MTCRNLLKAEIEYNKRFTAWVKVKFIHHPLDHLYLDTEYYRGEYIQA